MPGLHTLALAAEQTGPEPSGFVQGYLDAMQTGPLAPQSMAEVLRDSVLAMAGGPLALGYGDTAEEGAEFWRNRQARYHQAAFMPVTFEVRGGLTYLT